MQSWVDVSGLLRMGEGRLRSCEARVAQSRARLHQVELEWQALQGQGEGLRQLLLGTRQEGVHLTHQALLAGLRQQAVIRRQMHEVSVEGARLQQQREEIGHELRQRQVEQQAQGQKQRKYQRLQARMHRLRCAQRSLREESEAEDLLSSRPV